MTLHSHAHSVVALAILGSLEMSNRMDQQQLEAAILHQMRLVVEECAKVACSRAGATAGEIATAIRELAR